MKLSIFDYIDPAAYLKDRWEEKRKNNPMFSLRAWSKQLGFKTHTPLHYMIQGERNIPKKYVPLFIRSLDLKAKEGLYFETLIDLQRAKTMEEKEIYHERLKDLSPKPLRGAVELEAYKYLKDPIHIIISEMSELKGFKNDLKWIQDRLSIKASLADINEAIHRLMDLGLLELENGNLKKKYKHFTNKEDIQDAGVQEYHKNMCRMSIEQIEKFSVADREYNSFTLNIKKEKMKRAKELIRKFTDEFIQEVEAKSGTGEETYHVNLHFFPISK